MPAGPGKFENEPASTFLLWNVSLDGGLDDESGTVDEGGWYGRMDGPFTPDKDSIDQAREYGYNDGELVEAIIDLNNMAGAIVMETSTGFVFGTLYGDGFKDETRTTALLDKDWDSYSAYSEDSEDSEAI